MSTKKRTYVNKNKTVDKPHSRADQGKTGKADSAKTTEINGPKGLEPTRYGDWESKGRCHDF